MTGTTAIRPHNQLPAWRRKGPSGWAFALR